LIPPPLGKKSDRERKRRKKEKEKGGLERDQNDSNNSAIPFNVLHTLSRLDV